jgi:hypothetical protein
MEVLNENSKKPVKEFGNTQLASKSKKIKKEKRKSRKGVL